MAYGDGTLNLSGNLNVAIGRPLDARYILDNEADLTAAASWTAGGANYAYDGMMVYCKDTNKTYQLQGSNDYSISANWHEFVGSGSSGTAHDAMPSGRYDDVTWQATGSFYTAPADGYVFILMQGNAANQYTTLSVWTPDENSLIYTNTSYIGGTSGYCSLFYPISKNFKYKVSWTAANKIYFRFIYAQGSY